jgi:hypothetical protein
MRKTLGVATLAVIAITLTSLTLAGRPDTSRQTCSRTSCPRVAGENVDCGTCTRPCKPCPDAPSGVQALLSGVRARSLGA